MANKSYINIIFPKIQLFREECQKNEEAQADYDFMKETLKLKRQLAALQKGKRLLKKAEAFFAKKID